jgi:hypothetical protein
MAEWIANAGRARVEHVCWRDFLAFLGGETSLEHQKERRPNVPFPGSIQAVSNPVSRRATVINVFRDGAMSNANEPLLIGVPVVPGSFSDLANSNFLTNAPIDEQLCKYSAGCLFAFNF